MTDWNESFQRAKAHVARQRATENARYSGGEGPKPRTKREKSTSEIDRPHHFYGFGLAFCVHNRLYIEKCNACHRTEREARANAEKLF